MYMFEAFVNVRSQCGFRGTTSSKLPGCPTQAWTQDESPRDTTTHPAHLTRDTTNVCNENHNAISERFVNKPPVQKARL